MAVAIKLVRFGKRGSPSYRIVAIEKKEKRNGSYLEKLGFYNPKTEPAEFNLNRERFEYWIQKGALLSAGLVKLKKLLKRV